MASSGVRVLQVRKWMQIWEKCSYAHRQVDEQPSKKSKKNCDKSAEAILKITRQLGCVFQDMEPPTSTTILRKSLNTRKPMRCVRFTIFAPVNLISVTPDLQNVRIGLRKRRNGKSDVPVKSMELGQHILKLKEKHKTAFFSPSENRCLPAPSNLKPEETEFVVDPGASMHMISKGI